MCACTCFWFSADLDSAELASRMSLKFNSTTSCAIMNVSTNGLIRKFIGPISLENLDEIIGKAMVEMPPFLNSLPDYQSIHHLGKTNVLVNAEYRRITLPELERKISNGEFVSRKDFSGYKEKYLETLGQKMDKGVHETIIDDVVSSLKSSNVSDEILKIRAELIEARISDDVINIEPLYLLMQRLYITRYFTRSMKYLPENIRDLKNMFNMLSNVDLLHFPGNYLFNSVCRKLYSSAQAKTKGSEVIDVMYAYVAPFVDTFVSDGQIHETIRQVINSEMKELSTNIVNTSQFCKNVRNSDLTNVK